MSPTSSRARRLLGWRVLGAARTLAWVTVITVLVWVYADVQFTDRRDFDVTLGVTSSMDDLAVLSAQEMPIIFRLQGNRYALDRFAERLGADRWVIAYDAGRALGAGSRQERVAEIIGRMPRIRELGLEVLSAQPGTLEVVLDRLQPVTARVKLSVAPDMLSEYSIDPQTVTVLVPQSQMKALPGENPVVATEPLDLRKVPAGATGTRELTLEKPTRDARLAQGKVNVTFKVNPQLAEKPFKNVPVRIAYPLAWQNDGTWQKYKLVLRDDLDMTRDIVIRGSKIDLDKLQPGNIDAYVMLADDDRANVTLTENDKYRTTNPRAGQIQVNIVPTPTGDLPPDAKLRLTPDPAAPISYWIVKRADGGTP